MADVSDAHITTMTVEPPTPRAVQGSQPLALTIVWSAREPQRVGEVALVRGGRPYVLGRGLADFKASGRPLLFGSPRDDGAGGTPVRGAGISRRQLEICRRGDALQVTRVGRCPMVAGGRTVDSAELRAGECLTLHRQLVLLCTHWRSPARTSQPPHPFGEADAYGMVGEGYTAWSLRKMVGFCARSDEHVLLLGPTGSGKELAARAIHGLSSRADGVLESRNAATLPKGIIDAELFGNIADYPNPGTPERSGLIGAANGGTLFLDEVGELPSELQAHLLRVLDNGGEYQRLGEDGHRQSDFRLVAATNRQESELKLDFAARFPLRVVLPGLNQRREDIPLIARRLVSTAAQGNGELERFLDGRRLQIAPELIERLVMHDYQQHVRELNTLLWKAMSASEGDQIELTDELAVLLEHKTHDIEALSDAEIEQCLREHNGNMTRAASSLGLSRHALRRLLDKRGLRKKP